MRQWYVIQTKPKKEGVVCRQLAHTDCESFFPRMRGLDTVKPLFPSYLFVRTNLADPGTYQLIRYTRGVNRVLGDREGPRPVAADIVETLMTRTRDGSLIEQTLLFKEGDEVKARKGILKDLAGIIEKNMADGGRVRVLFTWLRRSMRAVVRYTDLEKVA